MPQVGGLTGRSVSLAALEAGSSAALLPDGGAPSGFIIGGTVPLSPRVAAGARELCGVSFIRTLIPFTRGPLP